MAGPGGGFASPVVASGARRVVKAPRSRSRRAETTAPILARPVFVSQHTAPLVLGFKSARAFLEWLPALEALGFKVIPRGQDRLVALEDAVAALAASAQTPTPSCTPAPASRSPRDELDDADDVLRALGVRPRPTLRAVGGSE